MSKLISSGDKAWVFLAEDDVLFVAIFKRIWNLAYAKVPILVADSVAGSRALLLSEATQPSVAILDQNLRDGDSAAIESLLTCPFQRWSASSSDSSELKPQGRVAMERAVREIAEMGGIDVPL